MDVTRLSSVDKNELANIIKDANLEKINQNTELVSVKHSFYTKYGKRMLDFVVALAAIIISCPINAIIAVVTLLDVGRPILFKQSRIGFEEKPFTIYKFRNMTNATDSNGNLLPPQDRVTKWGKFVRKTSLDELLNFVSILKGDMSLIGPRPLLDSYVNRFNKRHKQRYLVRPGLECPSFKLLDHAMTWDEKLENDMWYIQNVSLKVDLILLYRLFQLVFDKKSTAIRSKADAGGFLGYNEDGLVISTKQVPEEYCKTFCEKFGYSTIEEAFQKE